MNERKTVLASICQNHDVAILYLFGSRAQVVQEWVEGETAVLRSTDSDIDVGVKFHQEKPISVQDKVNVTLALEAFFGVPRVDLVVLTEADPFLAANIIRGERLYAEDAYLADEYDLYILRRAGDLAPLERQRMALILKEAS